MKGGFVLRDEQTGRFTMVQTTKGTSRASAKSEAAVKEASTKRSAALKRLSDR